MSSSSQAYARVSKVTASPREIEAQVLLKAASKFQAIVDNDNCSKSDFSETLLYNRKIWTILLTGVTNPTNPLPAEIRQNVANIGIFVMKRTRELEFQLKPEREKLKALIDINRNLAAGLSGQA